MRVLLVSANIEDINMPTLPLGLSLVASATGDAGHEVELFDMMAHDEPWGSLREKVASFGPGVIGVSVRNIDDQCMGEPRFLLKQAKDVVSMCREHSEAPIVLGGAGYSIFPESALGYLGADMGIRGEGEAAFPMLLERMERKEDIGSVPGLYLPGRGPVIKRSYIKDLDSLPGPEGYLAPSAGIGDEEVWLPVQTRRGCPMGCSYCSTPAIEGRILRKRSPAAVAASLERLAASGFERFYFTDNTFNLPPSYSKDLCRKIINKGLDITFRAILYPGRLTPGLAALMKDAGLREAALGFESGAQKVLSQFNKRFGPDDVRGDVKTLADLGVFTMGFLLLGGPGESKETVIESLEFADSLGLDALKITPGVRIYPGTELARIAKEQGIVPQDDDLLAPRFYLARGLSGWLEETVERWMSGRPNWFY